MYNVHCILYSVHKLHTCTVPKDCNLRHLLSTDQKKKKWQPLKSLRILKKMLKNILDFVLFEPIVNVLLERLCILYTVYCITKSALSLNELEFMVLQFIVSWCVCSSVSIRYDKYRSHFIYFHLRLICIN